MHLDRYRARAESFPEKVPNCCPHIVVPGPPPIGDALAPASDRMRSITQIKPHASVREVH
jgi:hypothetical protein